MIEYVAGKTKGATTNGDLFNNPFKLGGVDPDYTSDRVTEVVADGQLKVAWTPVMQGIHNTEDLKLGDVKVIRGNDTVYGTFASKEAAANGEFAGMTFKNPDGTPSTFVIAAGDKVAYVYNNIVVPQNDLPTLRAEMKSIALVARARRIAVYFSQIAAFQAKTDYGFDLGDQLAEKAVGQLSLTLGTFNKLNINKVA